MVKYDKYYEEEHHFGDPGPDLVKFFAENSDRGKVLDLGCGQGRDALALAGLGYEITGVDISQIGIEQMLREAKKNNLNVRGVIADIYEYPIDSSFDYILLDSMLHFYKREREKEIRFVQRIMNEMRIGAVLCILVSTSKTTESILESIFENESNFWIVLEDKYIRYPKVNSLYRMFIVQKV
ncbi:class I SAM-dependent methyltransferase [Candidatus Thorarchaeota archaeon]|nr:MAG: class I SAM-dependent methyltransferase [Candidatus Thorarchaeota archaeon]